MKKTVRIISVLLSILMIASTLGSLSVFATDDGYTKRTINAYIYKEDATRTFDCVFYDRLPEVPFIDPVDYLNTIYTENFVEEKNSDGTYTLSCDKCALTFDPDTETISTDSMDDVYSCIHQTEGSSIHIDYAKYISTEMTNVAGTMCFDLSEYGVDIIEYEGKVYVPVNVLSIMFSSTYNNATYLDDTLYFFHDKDDGSYYCKVDKSCLYNTLTRSQEFAEFSYQMLKLSFDRFYGQPSNIAVYDTLIEKGFDAVLEETDDTTRLIKQLLLSERTSDFLIGLSGLFDYFLDGGHTIMTEDVATGLGLYDTSPVISELIETAQSGSPAGYLIIDAIDSLNSFAIETISKMPVIRDAEYAKYADDVVKKWDSGSFLIVHGNVAVYVFDRFLPDTPYEFKEALDIADGKGVRNFIIDVSCNGGGIVACCSYIITMITNAWHHDNAYISYDLSTVTGALEKDIVEYDLNLDGEFNDEDKDFCYDFNFGILASWVSYSCGNLLPVRSKYEGIAILGDTSGGGSCITTNQYLPGGHFYSTSTIYKNYLPEIDFDLGAAPDFVLTAVNEDGSIDYTGLYDIDRLGELLEEFYSAPIDDPEEPVKPVTYNVKEGDGAVWTAGSSDGLTLTSDADYDRLVAVKVDGNELSKDDYTAEIGSTKITLKPGYLGTLSVGEHTLTIVSTDGEATAKFKVVAASHAEVKSPETGYEYHVFFPLAAMILSLGGAVTFAVIGKKKRVFSK